MKKIEKKIKCYRRFSNFDALNLKLREKFPYIIIPSLPKKMGMNVKQLIKVEEDFYSSRTRHLKSYLNYIFNHEALKDSVEFNKFLNNAEFDEKFFTLEDIGKQFQETEKVNKSSFTGQIYDYFSGFFKSKEYSRVPTQEESSFNKLSVHYTNLFTKFKALKKKIKSFNANIDEKAASNEEMANNFLYLREVGFESFNNKEFFSKYNDVLVDLHKINKKFLEEIGNSIVDKIRGFVSLLKGLLETFDRWNEFLVLFENVDKANFNSKSHPKSFNIPALNKEYQKIMDMKTLFVKNFQKEINDFCQNNKSIYTIIIDDFKTFINYINMNEKHKLSSIENYF